MIGAVTAGTRALVSSGTNPAAAPALPSGLVPGDGLVIIDMVRATTNTAPNAPTTPSGWSLKNSFTGTGVAKAMRLSWYYRTYASGLTAPSIALTAASGTAHYALMLRIPGMALTGDPTDYLGANGTPAASSTVVGPFAGATSAKAGGLVLVAGVRENDVTDGSSITAPTQTGLTFTLHDSSGTLSTDDWVFAVASAPLPHATSVGNLSFGITHDTAYNSIGQQWALNPEPERGFFPFLVDP